MNKAQRIALKLFGSAGEELEAESRDWYLLCPECGHETSYFEAGGPRFGAPSAGRKVRIRCERCQLRVWHELVHRPKGETEPPTG